MTLDSSGAALRASLQETVLHVALLAQGASIPEVHAWRARCIGLVERLEQAMRDDGRAGDVVRDVGIAQCMLLDEVTLRHLPADRRNEWLRETLLFRFHHTHSVASRSAAQFGALLNGSYSEAPLLNIYTTLLGLEPSHQGEAVRALPDAGCPVTSQVEPRTTSVGNEPTRRLPWPARSVATVAARACKPLRSILFATVALTVVWIFCDVSLRRAVERLPDSGPRVTQNSDGGHQ
ncbi:DotU family type IV/VI secretion system protein [Burkholderia ambifaria]|uniref:DotU family type IV/VI secretion system protein n=1 Tax=Burkholderia ambifaria TaxID=152480 RepID=A0AA41EC48_9BURK|nr:DotU family type IV/VI secretion system protein [Burkholderia ambifaria]MBR8132161.1 DotU family type IV/VI secretion system protein [Burkholderia ambifaria]PRE04664.1 type VI secretion system protein ImpK [Burkholderia ambifaria]